MGLSEFPDILSPVILHFGSDFGHGSLCDEISLIRCRCRSSTFSLDKTLRSAFSSRPGHGRPSGQFLESSYAFPGFGKRFHEPAMTENEWVRRER
jgi:hypothetical protein